MAWKILFTAEYAVEHLYSLALLVWGWFFLLLLLVVFLFGCCVVLGFFCGLGVFWVGVGFCWMVVFFFACLFFVCVCVCFCFSAFVFYFPKGVFVLLFSLISSHRVVLAFSAVIMNMKSNVFSFPYWILWSTRNDSSNFFQIFYFLTLSVLCWSHQCLILINPHQRMCHFSLFRTVWRLLDAISLYLWRN